MPATPREMQELVENGRELSFDQALTLANHPVLSELLEAANALRRSYHAEALDLCSIVNARSGRCSENCRFCAQSSHFDVDVETYESVDPEFAFSLAQQNDAYGVRRFSLVTAGRTIADTTLDSFAPLLDRLARETGMSRCASMGMLTTDKARKLVAMGVSRYHCNLETSRSFFPSVCTTHTWQEKVETIEIARLAGMDICSGGIIGLGETPEQRLELAFELRDLGVLSIPLNVLNPIPGTPFENHPRLDADEVLRCIAIFRFVNPEAVIRLAGGRGILGVDQSTCFEAGANGAIVGDYLTTTGAGLQNDIEMFERLGFDMQGYSIPEGETCDKHHLPTVEDDASTDKSGKS